MRPTTGRPRDTDDVTVADLDGRTVIPGLWDEHVHAEQWALASRRFEVSQTASPAEVLQTVHDHLERLPGDGQDIIIQGFGLRASRWRADPSAADLDAVCGPWPVAIVSADLHSTWCSTAALRKLGMNGKAGFLTEADSFAAQTRLARVPRRILNGWLDQCCRRAAACGVVGIRDMEFSSSVDVWTARRSAGGCPMRVEVSVYPDRLDEAVDRGLRTGRPATPGSLVTMGPLKIIVDGSMSTRSAWCHRPYPGAVGPDRTGVDSVAPDELVELMRRARAAGLTPAAHAIGDLAVGVVLDAFERSGAHGFLEHAQLVADADLRRFAQLGVTASVQPAHLIDDRETTDAIWTDRAARSFRFRDLLEAGARLILGSDAPVSPVDPWLAIRVAVERTGDDRPAWHPEQAITMSQALRASTHGIDAVRVGGPADLVALDANPFELHGDELASPVSALTMAGGRISHTRL
ncbi:amidohydrolase family protein [Acidipropionibacterium virtanenii]